MNKMFKKISILVLTCCILISLTQRPLQVSASTRNNAKNNIIYMDDGDYIIVSTFLPPAPSTFSTYSTVSTISPSKSYKYYNAKDELCWSFTLYATFKYDGILVACTDTSSTAAIYKSTWSLVSKSTSKNGGEAIGTIHVKTSAKSVSKTLTITCTKNGTIN